jgi:uncharacterized membrane protein
MQTIARALRMINIFASGIVAGGFIMVSASLVPAKRHFPHSTAVELHQVTTPTIDAYMPPASALAGVTGILLLLLRRRASSTATRFTVLGILSTLSVAIASIFFNMPANRTIATWTPPDVPSNYPEIRDRWDRVHLIRTIAGVLSFVCFLRAGLADTQS